MELTVLVALLAGIVSFASPCFLPIVPVFVGQLVGSGPGRADRRVALGNSLAFNYGHVTLPDQTVMYVISPASGQAGRGIAPGQVRAELRRGEKTAPLTSTVIDMGVATSAGDHSFTFQREQQFTGMILRNDPGTGIVWAGFALLVVGTCMTMFFRHQRLWVRAETEACPGSRSRGAATSRSGGQRPGFHRYGHRWDTGFAGGVARQTGAAGVHGHLVCGLPHGDP